MSTTMKNARSKTAQPMSDELNSELATLFEHQLKDTYFAEKAITKALPKMIKAAHSNELKRAFEKHLEQTQGHVCVPRKRLSDDWPEGRRHDLPGDKGHHRGR